MAKTGQYGFVGLSIGSEFLRVKHRDRVPGFNFCAFVHCKALNAPAHLGADHNLIGVNGSDQHEIGTSDRKRKSSRWLR